MSPETHRLSTPRSHQGLALRRPLSWASREQSPPLPVVNRPPLRLPRLLELRVPGAHPERTRGWACFLKPVLSVSVPTYFPGRTGREMSRIAQSGTPATLLGSSSASRGAPSRERLPQGPGHIGSPLGAGPKIPTPPARPVPGLPCQEG